MEPQVKITDFRIGNTITTILNDEWVNVTRIIREPVADGYYECVKVEGHETSFIKEHIVPVKLSDVVMGRIKNIQPIPSGEGIFYALEVGPFAFHINHIENDVWAFRIRKGLNYILLTGILYLHELQNIVALITNEELKFNS